jgi:hypothetical protein
VKPTPSHHRDHNESALAIGVAAGAAARLALLVIGWVILLRSFCQKTEDRVGTGREPFYLDDMEVRRSVWLTHTSPNVPLTSSGRENECRRVIHRPTDLSGQLAMVAK